MCCKITWKVWVVILSIISILLLALVVKLVYDKATRDNLKAQTLEYINNVEALLEAEYDRINLENWDLHRNSTNEIENELAQRNQMNYEVLLQGLKANVSALPWKSFNSSVLSRKLLVTQQLPVYLLSKQKTKNLKDVKLSIHQIQTDEIRKFEAIKSQSIFDHVLPKTLKYCNQKILNRRTWTEYHDSAGRQVKPLYPGFVKLMNEEAILNKFPHASSYSLTSAYEIEAVKFQEMLTKLWEQIKPFYFEFHAYLRGELTFQFPGENIGNNGAIPSQFLDVLDPKKCSATSEITKPYPGKLQLNITEELLIRRYSPVTIAKFAEDFVSSIELPIMLPAFWSESLFLEPKHRPNFNCDPKLFILRGNSDFRVSLCGGADEETLVNVNRLIIQATLKSLLSKQAFLLRQPITSALNTAAEDALLMAMSSQPYLRRMGLLSEYEEDLPATLNRLYTEAFELFPKLTQALALNQWFLDIYTEKVKTPKANCHWWTLRSSFDGTKPPGPRKSADFDPAAYQHLTSSPAESIQVFVSSILKFQIYERLCILASSQPLDEPQSSRSTQNSITVLNFQTCDLSRSFLVGESISKMLSAGSSKPWKDLLGLMDIRDGLNATSLLKYFEPLYTYLKEVNSRRERPTGWHQLVSDYCK